MEDRPRLKRFLLKVSGEVFGGESLSIDMGRVERFAAELGDARSSGAEIAVVVGGGNIVRGSVLSRGGADRVSSDYMGMLGTVINAIALQGALERLGVEARVMTPFSLEQIVERYIRSHALNHLGEGRLLILAGGTGNPYFTTDTAAALRAAEIKADVLLKGTKVDGIYDCDPVKNPGASLKKKLGFTEVLGADLKVMDATAVALCRDNSMPIIVFNIMESGNLVKVIEGETIGTIVQ